MYGLYRASVVILEFLWELRLKYLRGFTYETCYNCGKLVDKKAILNTYPDLQGETNVHDEIRETPFR